MSTRQGVLAGLVALLLLAVYFFTVAAGSGHDSADPADSGGIEFLDRALSAIPGVGRPLRSDDVDAGCFDGRRFTITATTSCAFTILEGIDRGRLRRTSGSCRIRVTDQEDTIDQSYRLSPDRNDDITLGLDGSGATVLITAGPCTIAVVE